MQGRQDPASDGRVFQFLRRVKKPCSRPVLRSLRTFTGAWKPMRVALTLAILAMAMTAGCLGGGREPEVVAQFSIPPRPRRQTPTTPICGTLSTDPSKRGRSSQDTPGGILTKFAPKPE